MNRISGIEKSQAPWHLRWFYTTASSMSAVMSFIKPQIYQIDKSGFSL